MQFDSGHRKRASHLRPCSKRRCADRTTRLCIGHWAALPTARGVVVGFQIRSDIAAQCFQEDLKLLGICVVDFHVEIAEIRGIEPRIIGTDIRLSRSMMIVDTSIASPASPKIPSLFLVRNCFFTVPPTPRGGFWSYPHRSCWRRPAHMARPQRRSVD